MIMARCRLIAAVAMAMAVVFGISAKTTKGKANTFEAPDFAFPKTVEKNALAMLEKGLRTGDGPLTLRAAMQTAVSRNLVSSDSYGRNIALFDSLSRVLPAPYGSLALLLEARIYRDIYTSSRWRFNSRELPAGDAPDNVLEWNRDLFADKVEGLTREAMSRSDAAAGMAIGTLGSLADDTAQASRMGMSVLDFMTFRAVDLLDTFGDNTRGETIPFGNEAQAAGGKDLAAGYIADAVSRNEKTPESAAVFRMMMLSRLTGDTRDKYLDECVDRYFTTPWCAPFLQEWDAAMSAGKRGAKEDNGRRRTRLTRLRDYCAAFPDAPGIVTLRRCIDRLEQKSVDVRFPSAMLPGATGEGEVSAANVYDLTLLVYRVPDSYATDRNGRGLRFNRLSSEGSRVAAIPVRLEGTVPDRVTAKYTIPALKPGLYTIVASTNGQPSGIMMKDSQLMLSMMLVSKLTTIVASEPDDSGRRSLYVADAADGTPVRDAKVTFTSTKYRDNRQETAVTDSEGRALTTMQEFSFVAEKEGSLATGSQYFYNGTASTRSYLSADVLTDLSLFRPGQEVAFAAVVYRKDGHRISSAPDEEVRMVLRDANYQDVDTLELRTDSFGRCDGKFTLPKEGLLGSWTLMLYKGDDTLGQASVDVAEYKSPTFFVTAESAMPSYKAGETIKVTGKAMTYSGMPVAGGKVRYMVRFTPLWWWRDSGSAATYGGEAESGADGSFGIELPTAGLRGTRFCCGRYDISIDVTDAAGETQAVSVPFSVGEAFSLYASVPALAPLSGEGRLEGSVMVRDAIGRPAVRTVSYVVLKDSTEVASGSFESPGFVLDTSLLQPGRYRILFSLDKEALARYIGEGEGYDGTVQVAEAVTVLYRPADTRPPVDTPLWTVEKEITVPAGEKEVSVQVGSSYPGSRILVEVADENKVVSREWISRDGMTAPFRVNTPGRDGRVFVTFVGVHDFRTERTTVTLVPAFQKEQLEVETVTFRDRIEPGAKEAWRFRFTTGGRACAGIPVMAVMTDKSLNAISPFTWSLNPYATLSWTRPGNLLFENPFETGNSVSVGLPARKEDYTTFSEPEWNLYGQALYRTALHIRGTRMMKTSAAINMAAVRDEAKEESADDGADAFYAVEAEAPAAGAVLEESMVTADGPREDGNASDSALPPAREKEHPLAFFMPALHADGEGYVDIPFTAPDFTGTWQFQIAGYTADMKGVAKAMDAVASKKVMAQLNAPRFVRTGDRVTLAATLYNNTDLPLQIGGRIVVTDAATGATVLSGDEAAVTVGPSASRVISVELAAPSDMSLLTVSAYALADGASDGERTALPVLPSSTPVVESVPFWLAPGEADESFRLPRYADSAEVTLQYCSNPAWECVTALPGITQPSSVNVLSRVKALYATALAGGLFNRYPALPEGIRLMAAPENAQDSTLVSPLEKNASLKMVALRNTPWVNSAAAETARMRSLLEYADPANASAAVSALVKQIGDSRNPDGGWSWCPDMPSSEYITETVLTSLAELNRLGFMPDGAKGWIKKGFSYCDTELAREWEETGRKHYSVTGLLGYLYAKSAFEGVGASARFAPLDRLAMKEIAAGWRDFDIHGKATAALLLASRGDVKTASLILESLSQFASSDKSKGTWFDNLGSSWNGAGKLLTTARVLRAYARLQPDNGIIDGLRQWLVLSRQTEDWGADGNLAEVTAAILGSGTDWTGSTSLPEVTLGGKTVNPGRAAALTGAFTVTLPVREASGAGLRVRKTGAAPSWGGVVSQYVAPIRDVKAASLPQLSVRKALYSLMPGKEGYEVTEDALHTGDRVRVTLFITSDRDMDYVAVTDSRAACLEPADQLSAYTSSDGLWFYREVRDEATNLFIPFLPKGTHVISYDCFAGNAGECSLGIATAQSQYAPVITAHSAGAVITVDASR